MTRDVLKHSTTLSYGDLLYGIPNALLAVESVLFGIAYFYAFGGGDYGSKARAEKPMGFIRAAFHALNPADLILGIVRAVSLALGSMLPANTDSYQSVAYSQHQYPLKDVYDEREPHM
jgi:hypothetical protein